MFCWQADMFLFQPLTDEEGRQYMQARGKTCVCLSWFFSLFLMPGNRVTRNNTDTAQYVLSLSPSASPSLFKFKVTLLLSRFAIWTYHFALMRVFVVFVLISLSPPPFLPPSSYFSLPLSVSLMFTNLQTPSTSFFWTMYGLCMFVQFDGICLCLLFEKVLVKIIIISSSSPFHNVMTAKHFIRCFTTCVELSRGYLLDTV